MRYVLILVLTVLSPVLAPAMVFGPPLLVAEIYDRIVYLYLRRRLRRQIRRTFGVAGRSRFGRTVARR